MAGIPLKYYRVCDRCGALHSVNSEDAPPFECRRRECDSTTGWEYTRYSAALAMQRQIAANKGAFS